MRPVRLCSTCRTALKNGGKNRVDRHCSDNLHFHRRGAGGEKLLL